MCPFCFANLALIAAGTVSGGGVAAVFVSKLRARRKAKKISADLRQRLSKHQLSTGGSNETR